MTHPTIPKLAELGREHRTAVHDQVALTNLLKARVREYVGREALATKSGEKLDTKKLQKAYKTYLVERADPLFVARIDRILGPRDACSEDQARLAREMGKLVKPLAVWKGWAEGVLGIDAKGLGKLLGEIPGREENGLGDFRSPASVWHWFGLHVEDGVAPKRAHGKSLGFSIYRRSVAWVVGSNLVKSGLDKRRPEIGAYAALYLEKKSDYVKQAHAQGLEVLPAAKIKEANRATTRSEGHVHMRALRCVTKRFLRDLWRAWRDLEAV